MKTVDRFQVLHIALLREYLHLEFSVIEDVCLCQVQRVLCSRPCMALRRSSLSSTPAPCPKAFHTAEADRFRTRLAPNSEKGNKPTEAPHGGCLKISKHAALRPLCPINRLFALPTDVTRQHFALPTAFLPGRCPFVRSTDPLLCEPDVLPGQCLEFISSYTVSWSLLGT